MLVTVRIEQPFFLDGVEVVLPGPPGALVAVGGVALAGAREARGSRLAGVRAQGGVGVGVGRGARRALQRARLERVRGLLAVVGGVP